MVIGVVAALTIPALMQNINETTNKRQQDVIEKKFMEGLRQMRTDDVLSTTYTTSEFVQKMGNYFKIVQVCDSSNLVNCFSSTINTISNGESTVFETSTLKNTTKMNKNYEDADVYGIKFVDGSSMLLAYKPNCHGPEAGDKNPKEENAKLTGCIYYLFDTNGNKSPNTIAANKDMFGNVSISPSKPYGLSFDIIGIYESSYNYTEDVNYCAAQNGRLPNRDEVFEMYKKIYALNFDTTGMEEVDLQDYIYENSITLQVNSNDSDAVELYNLLKYNEYGYTGGNGGSDCDYPATSLIVTDGVYMGGSCAAPTRILCVK